MANHIEIDNLQSLSVVPYSELRQTLRSGDLLFASGDYLVSRTIQKLTHSPWSHVGIIFRLDSIDRVLLLESVEDMGVRFAPLSKYLTDYADGKPYQGILALARCQGFKPTMIAELAKFGIDELTRPYDKKEVAHIIARIALGIGKAEQDQAYICSELVYECFAHSGKFFPYDRRGFISPENIWRDEELVVVGRIL